nr:hypothetical protein Itr_chr11CG18630 [Ipomoea trifida]
MQEQRLLSSTMMCDDGGGARQWSKQLSLLASSPSSDGDRRFPCFPVTYGSSFAKQSTPAARDLGGD